VAERAASSEQSAGTKPVNRAIMHMDEATPTERRAGEEAPGASQGMERTMASELNEMMGALSRAPSGHRCCRGAKPQLAGRIPQIRAC